MLLLAVQSLFSKSQALLSAPRPFPVGSLSTQCRFERLRMILFYVLKKSITKLPIGVPLNRWACLNSSGGKNLSSSPLFKIKAICRNRSGSNWSIYFYKRSVQETVALRQTNLGLLLFQGCKRVRKVSRHCAPPWQTTQEQTAFCFFFHKLLTRLRRGSLSLRPQLLLFPHASLFPPLSSPGHHVPCHEPADWQQSPHPR